MAKINKRQVATATQATLSTRAEGDMGSAQLQRISVVVADQQELVRIGLRLLLQVSTKVEVIGEAKDGPAAVGLVEKLRPTILLSELELPRLHGFDVLSALKGTQTRMIIVSRVHDELTIAECLRLGAIGYVQKRSSL